MKTVIKQALAGVVAAGIGPLVSAGLIAHYTLDETSGTTALDISGNNLHGTVSGGAIGDAGAIQSVAGKFGQAYSFSGTTAQRVDADYAAWDGLNLTPGYSISAWFNWTTPGANNRSAAITLTDDDIGLNDRYADLGIGDSQGADVNADGSVYARHRTGATIIDTNPTKSGDPPNGGFNDGEWHHVAGVYTDTGVSVYVDGLLVDSQEGTGTDIAFDALAIGLLQRPGAQSDVDPYEGAIDDVRVYDHALSQAEISALVPEPGSLAIAALGGLAMLQRRRR